MGNIHDRIKKDLPRIKESAEKIKEIVKKDIEKLKDESEKIKELVEKDKARILEDLYGEGKKNENI